MRDINWYNPEQNVFRAIARAQNRGAVVEPYGVPEWLLGVAPGTPALPDAGQVSFRGNVRRPSYGQTVAATFGYADAGACPPCRQREAGDAMTDAYENARRNFLDAAETWGWNVADINAVDWSDDDAVGDVLKLLIGMVSEFCGVPYATAAARIGEATFLPDSTALNRALLAIAAEYCPNLTPATPVEVDALPPDWTAPDYCPAGETMTEIPVYVNGKQVGTSKICAPVDRVIIPPGDETELNGAKEKKKAYPVWGYYVAGGVGLLAVGGVAYYATRNR